MTDFLVVGSGPSAVHFAITALETGASVTMVDVGFSPPAVVAPADSFEQLKDDLPDPVAYFLGPQAESVVYPGSASSYYGHPPSKAYVFAKPDGFAPQLTGMRPEFSFARGGLAGAWTAGSYPWSPQDFRDFPFADDAMAPAYETVVHRIGVTGVDDDLSPFFPFAGQYQPPLPLDRHSAHLLDRYGAGRRTGRDFVLGRSRVATLSEPLGGRAACAQLGRCLWGCPTQSLYNPASTVEQCQTHPGFRYEVGQFVTRLALKGGRVSGVVTTPLAGGADRTFEADRIVLAAGALNTSQIYLATIRRETGSTPVLQGLMDNRQIHMPFLTPAMVGQPVESAQYQFHHLAFALPGDGIDYVHGQITTLKAAAVHPIVASLPAPLAISVPLFRAIRAGLGVANINLGDTRREESHLTLTTDNHGRDQLAVHYVPAAEEPARRARAISAVRRALRQLGSLVPPGMTRVLPMGNSAHYAGTLPMTATEADHTSDAAGRVRGFENLYVVDGAAMPFLPAKNLTLTLMANATRVARSLT